ncbi:hypothetical protein E4T56_gene10149 [Termitomyces sp. T112]|nr:hypothetical protein E4T56_gene10149 [Termitomyces sp. T112]
MGSIGDVGHSKGQAQWGNGPRGSGDPGEALPTVEKTLELARGPSELAEDASELARVGAEHYGSLARHWGRFWGGRGSLDDARRSREWVVTDPNHLISAYFQALQSAKQKLSAFGININNPEFKDVLLMHLDKSFHSVCLNILAQSPKPDLAKIKVMLTSSTATDSVTIGSEGASAAQG